MGVGQHYHSGEAARYLSEGHLTPPGRRPRRNRAAVTAYSELEKGGRWHTGGVDDGDDSATDDEVELRKEVMDRRVRAADRLVRDFPSFVPLCADSRMLMNVYSVGSSRQRSSDTAQERGAMTRQGA